MISVKKYIRHETIKLKKLVNVRFRIYEKGMHLSYTSNIKIIPTLWDFDSQLYGFSNQYIDPLFKVVNERLNLVHSIILEVCKKYDNSELSSEFLTVEVNRELNIHDTEDDLLNKPFADCFLDYVLNHKMNEKRRKYFKVVLKSFLAFESYLMIIDKRTKQITYNSITHKLLNQFADFIIKEKEIAEKYPEIHAGEKRKLQERCSETGDNYLRYFRCVINKVREDAGTDFYPMKNFRIKSAKVNKPVALTTSEIKLLYDFKSDNEMLNLVRDNFLLQLCTVARIDDFYHIQYNSILFNKTEGINYLCFTPKKTVESSGKQVEIPFNNLARELIVKYKGCTDLLISHYSEQYYNRKLKVLFEAAGLDRIIVQYDKVKKTDVHRPLYSLVTSHTARKTSISRLYNAGCPLDMINDICGHVGDDIKSRYAEFDISAKLEYMNQLCPWYMVEQPLIDVKNDIIIESKIIDNKKFIPFVANRMVI
ncbi:MAG: tyrosine-type recombinase/integrase [Paludibacter sp.]|nr:tyrosine-type recombinase/integrase [Paludibacter sp.]